MRRFLCVSAKQKIPCIFWGVQISASLSNKVLKVWRTLSYMTWVCIQGLSCELDRAKEFLVKLFTYLQTIQSSSLLLCHFLFPTDRLDSFVGLNSSGWVIICRFISIHTLWLSFSSGCHSLLFWWVISHLSRCLSCSDPCSLTLPLLLILCFFFYPKKLQRWVQISQHKFSWKQFCSTISSWDSSHQFQFLLNPGSDNILN